MLHRRSFATALLSLAFFGLAAFAADVPEPPAPKPIVPGAEVIPLWPAGSPQLKPDTKGFNEPEQFKTWNGSGSGVDYIINIHNPSIEVHLAPPDKANGCAIIVAAGGGNQTLNVGPESVEIAKWLNGLGIAVFIERYRLKPYDSTVDALADTQRSFRIIRANAERWRIDPRRVGIMGFSAGGEQCALIELNFDEGKPDAKDPIERQSCRPDFNVLVYAGWRKMEMEKVPAKAPPAFLVCAGLDDTFHAKQTVEFYQALFSAKIPVELHIYARGGHGGGIQPRKGIPFGKWPVRCEEWMADQGFLKKTKSE